MDSRVSLGLIADAGILYESQRLLRSFPITNLLTGTVQLFPSFACVISF
jgi:hypothetical protein